MKPLTTLLVIICLNNYSQAQTFSKVFQPRGNGQDCIIQQLDSSCGSGHPFQYFIDSNFHHTPELGILAWTHSGCPIFYRTLIRFAAISDTTKLPSPMNATIIKATLTLYHEVTSANSNWGNSSFPGSPYVFPNIGYVYALNAHYNPQTVNWRNHPGQKLFDSVMIPISAERFGNDSVALDVTSLVQDMHTNGNTGFLLKLKDEVHYQAHLFASSKHPDTTRHPKLEITYASSVGIASIEPTNLSVKVFPNPTSKNLTLISNRALNGQMFLVNLLGKTIWSRPINSVHEVVDVTDLSSGVYYLVVKTPEEVITKRIIKK